MLLAIAAPHTLILDELTNYLYIESWGTLGDAFKDYHDCIILISHDVDFVEMVVDRLRLAGNGRVSVLNGDMAGYQKCLLVERGVLKMASAGKLETKRTDKQLSIGCQHWQNT